MPIERRDGPMSAARGDPTLRLLVVTSLVPTRQRPDFGIFNHRQMALLARLGVDVRVVVPRLWLPGKLRGWTRFPALCDPDPVLPAGVRGRLAWFLHPPGRALARFEWLSRYPAVRIAATRWHAREPFDVVLGIDMTADAVAAVRMARTLGVPVATLAIGSDVMLRPHRCPGLPALLSKTLAATDLPLGVSRSVCGALSATGACRRPPLAVVLGREPMSPAEAGERIDRRRALGIDPSHRVAVYVGGLTEDKGMADLLAAVRPMLESHPGLRLCLVGEGPYEAAWRELAGSIGDPARIRLTGRVAPGEVRGHLAAADFMVFPSRSEGLPQAVLEAMECGLPVVGTRVGGIPEAVEDGTNGLLVPPADPAALAAAIDRMIADPAFLGRCAVASLARAAALFDSERNAVKLVEALRSIVVPGP